MLPGLFSAAEFMKWIYNDGKNTNRTYGDDERNRIEEMIQHSTVMHSPNIFQIMRRGQAKK